jgi:hypothetical protein
VRLHENKSSADECITVSQFFTRPRARQFERNTEERLANLEAENEWPPGIRRVVHVEYECSGEEIQPVMTVNGKVRRSHGEDFNAVT